MGVAERQVGKGRGWLKRTVSRRLIERGEGREVFTRSSERIVCRRLFEEEPGRGREGGGSLFGFLERCCLSAPFLSPPLHFVRRAMRALFVPFFRLYPDKGVTETVFSPFMAVPTVGRPTGSKYYAEVGNILRYKNRVNTQDFTLFKGCLVLLPKHCFGTAPAKVAPTAVTAVWGVPNSRAVPEYDTDFRRKI